MLRIAILLALSFVSCDAKEKNKPGRHETNTTRPAGINSYKIKITENDGTGNAFTEVFFRLETTKQRQETIILDSIFLKHKTAATAERYIPGETCRKQWNAINKEAGRIRIDTLTSLNANIPDCVPETVFGAVTDITSFLFIQSAPEFGLNKLQQGNVQRFEPFSVKWQHQPELQDAFIECPGGTTHYEKDSSHCAIVNWTPDLMNLYLLRLMPGQQKRLILTGTEKFSLQIAIDKSSGKLLHGRSKYDHLDLKMWFPVELEQINDEAKQYISKDGGMPVKISRELVLEQVE